MKHTLFHLSKIIFLLFLLNSYLFSFSDDELLILEMRANNYIVSEGIDIYKQDGEFLLPLVLILRTLDFFIDENFETNCIKGWVFASNNTFEIDLNSKIVKIGTETFEFKVVKDDPLAENTKEIASEIYIEKRFFEVLFSFLNIVIDTNNSIINVKSDQPLPIEIKKEREKARKLVKNSIFYTPKIDRKDIKTSNQLFTFPFLDFYTSYFVSDSFDKEKKAYYSDQRYSLSSNGVFAGFDTEFSLNTESFDSLDSARLVMSKYSPYKELFGFASHFKMGDISLQAEPLISRGSYGTGFFLSTFRNEYQNQTNSIQITGELQNDWEVEISRDGILLDVVTQATSGMYRFENIATFNGLNIFNLKFYGPYGQVREEEKRIYIDNNIKSKGSFDMTMAVIKQKQPILKEYMKYQPVTNQDILQYIFDAEAGINSLLTLTGGFVVTPTLEDPINDRKQYARLGAKTAFGGMLFNVNSAVNDQDNGFAGSLSAETKVLGYSIFSEYQGFSDFQSEQSSYFGRYLDNYESFQIDKPMMILPFRRLPMNFILKRAVAKEEGATYLEKSLRISQNLFNKYRLSLTLSDKNNFYDQKLKEARFLFNSRYGKLNVKGDLLSNIYPNNKLVNMSVASDYPINEKITLAAQWNRNFLQDNNLNIYSFGLSRDLNYGSIGLDLQYDSNDNYSVFTSYNLALGYDYRKKRVALSAEDYSKSGVVIARVFIDKNNDGIYNFEDVPLENVRLKSRHVGFRDKTDKDGLVVLKGVPAYTEVDIFVDLESLDDIYWYSKKSAETVMLQPGTKVELAFPILETGDIEGVLYFDGDILRGFPLFLLDEEGKLIKKIYSEMDGYFLYEQIPIGKYFLTLDKTQFVGYTFSESDSREVAIEVKSENPVLMLGDVVLEKN